jgi:hypothetical protein
MRFLTAVSLAISASPPAQAAPVSVTVSSAPQEKMASRLASAVLKELKRDPRFTLAEHGRPALDIALPARVGAERRLDWTEIHYQARLTSPTRQSRVIAGHCWNWNLTVCAKQIADAAARTGDN